MSATTTLGWPEALPQHISASQLELFSRCAEAWRRKYLQREFERASGAMLLGRSVDDAVTFNLSQKIATGTDLKERDVVDYTATALDAAVDQSGDDINWGDTDYTKTQTTALKLVEAFQRNLAPGIQPIAVQRKVSYHPASLPIPILGYVDYETQSVIGENKTAGRKESKPKPSWWMQAVTYAAETSKPVEFSVGVKTVNPYWITPVDYPTLRVDPVAGAVVERLIGNRLRQMHTYYIQYGADEPWPDATLHPWSCSFCGYRPTCSWWAWERAA